MKYTIYTWFLCINKILHYSECIVHVIYSADKTNGHSPWDYFAAKNAICRFLTSFIRSYKLPHKKRKTLFLRRFSHFNIWTNIVASAPQLSTKSGSLQCSTAAEQYSSNGMNKYGKNYQLTQLSLKSHIDNASTENRRSPPLLFPWHFLAPAVLAPVVPAHRKECSNIV